MYKAFFYLIFYSICISLSAQSDTIFIEEYDTIYLAPKTIVVDSVVFIERNPIHTKTSIFLSSGFFSPQFNSNISTLRATYSDSLNNAFSNFIGFRNGFNLQQKINKITAQFGVEYSFTRFKFSHIDIDSTPYSCHNSIREFHFSTLIGYNFPITKKLTISPFLGIKLASVQKISGLAYHSNEINYRSYLSEIGTFSNSYLISTLNVQFIYSTQKLDFGFCPEFNYQLSKLTTSESIINLKGWDLGIKAMIGYKI